MALGLIPLAEGDLNPKEAMLDAMRVMQRRAADVRLLVNDLRQQLVGAATPAERADIAERLLAAEERFDRYLAAVVDTAYKAAPYVHARLTAMMVRNDANDRVRTPMQTLMAEIDKVMRGPVGRGTDMLQLENAKTETETRQ